MFRKTDLLKAHLRDRFHVTPKDGSPPFDGVLTEYSPINYKFEDVRVNGHNAASPLVIDRANVSYIQAFVTAPAVVTHVAV